MFEDNTLFTYIENFVPYLLALLEQHAGTIALVCAALYAGYVIRKRGEAIAIKARLLWLAFKYRRFRLGTFLAPDRFGWFSLERLLCGDYYRIYTLCDKDLGLFDKAHSALRKGHELGRRLMPLWMKGLIGNLVFAEAVVFGMLIALLGFDTVTPSQQPYFGGMIGAVLAIVLMLATHFAGEEWRRNELIKKAGDMAREMLRNGTDQSASALAKNTKISIARDHLDDDAPGYQQLLNRLNTNYTLTPSWRWTKGTLIFIVILTVLSFTARLSVSDLVEPAHAQQSDTFAGLSLDGLDDLLADDVVTKVASDFWNATGKLSTLLILTMIFLGIQALSLYIARAYGFATIEGYEAYKIIRKYRSREEYINRQKALQTEIINAGQAGLGALQQKIIESLSERGVDAQAFEAAQRASDRTMLAFIHARKHEERQHDYEDL